MAELDFAEREEAERNRPRVYASRFDGWEAFKARLYRTMLEQRQVPPPTVDIMRPSQVAAVLHLDELDEVVDGPRDSDGEIMQTVRAVPAEEQEAPQRDPNLDRSKTRTERLRERLQALPEPEVN